MKIGIIIFLSRYYDRIPSRDVNNFKFMIIPIIALFLPVSLVISQPDLGTALLIAISGLFVVWLAGFKMKFFAYSSVIFICLAPVVI